MREHEGARGARRITQRLRARLTYANVMSTFAVFGVLATGGAYAASKIGAKDIAKGAVRAKHIKGNQVKAKHVAGDAIRTAKVRDGAVTAAKLAAGAVGATAIADSIPAARVSHDASQEVAPSGATKLEFNEPRYDTAGLHNPGVPSRLRAPVDGVYLITANVEWEEKFPPPPDQGDEAFTVGIMQNIGTIIALERVDGTDFVGEAPHTTAQELSTQALLEAGDVVEVIVAHTSNSSRGIASFSSSSSLESSPEFAMTWLAPGPAG